MNALFVGLAGFFGAIARYGVDSALMPKSTTVFPVATFLVNTSGSFVLGLLATLFTERFVDSETLRLALTVGFLGAYTTFSTLAYQAIRMMQDGATPMAAGYIAASVAAGMLAAYAGILIARTLS